MISAVFGKIAPEMTLGDPHWLIYMNLKTIEKVFFA